MPLQNKHSYFLHCFEFVNYQCIFYTGIAIFTLLRKTVFCSVKIAMLWLFFGCILEQCNFYTQNCKTTFSTVLKSGTNFRRHDIRAKPRARRHSSTAAETHRRTRHTPHDTNTKGSCQFRRLVRRRCSPGVVRDTPFPQVGISGLSGQVTDGGMFLDPVCIFTRCQPFAFGVLRVIMSEPSLNVQMIGCRARVGTHMPVGRPCWSQIIRFHHRVTEHFPFFIFSHVKRCSAIFHWSCKILQC